MRDAAPAWWPGERRSLAIAVLLSLALHVLLLAAWHAPREGAPLQPAFVVTLTGAFIAPQRPQVVQPPPAAPAPPPVAPVASKKPAAQPERSASADAVASEPTAERVRSTAAPAATPERPAASKVASSEPAATDDLTFYRADQLSQGPVPASDPSADRIAAAHLVGRRLVVTVFVDAQGAVHQALVAPYEISEQQAALLQQAVAAVRFAPANIDGKAVAAQVQSRLCFDDAGLLDTSSPGCWQFNPQPAH